MKITRRKLKRIISEKIAHSRDGNVDFPIVVRYGDRSEIAYNQVELDDILDMISGGPGSKMNIPYSLDPLDDVEPKNTLIGSDIEHFAEGKIKVTRRQLRKIIAEAMTPAGDVTTPSELEQHVFPSKHSDKPSKDTDYYHIETIVMTVGKLMPEGFTVNDVFDHIYKNKLEPYTEMSFDELHQVMIDMARDKILDGYEDFFMLVI